MSVLVLIRQAQSARTLVLSLAPLHTIFRLGVHLAGDVRKLYPGPE